jgi:hypothetical protein
MRYTAMYLTKPKPRLAISKQLKYKKVLSLTDTPTSKFSQKKELEMCNP